MGKKRSHPDSTLPESINMSELDGDADGNFAVYFPSGFNPNDSQANCQWEAYGRPDRKKQYTIVAKTAQNVDFIGSTSSLEYGNALPCKYALGIFDKSTGSLEVASLPPGNFMRMEPRARNLSYQAIVSPTKEAAAAAERREQNMRLVEEFGSQRRRRQLAAAKAAQVDANQVSAGGAILGLIASQNPDAATKEDVLAASLAERNIPPHHPEATTREGAYRIKEVIPSSIFDALEIRKLFPAVDKMEYRNELAQQQTFGAGYILSRLRSSLGNVQDTETRENRARCLVMAGHLFKMYTQRGGVLRAEKGVAESAKRLKMDSSVLEGILDLFYHRDSGYDGDRYVLSKDKKDLMLAYILILAVMAENECSLDPQGFLELTKELKMRGGDLIQRFRELGCTGAGLSIATDEGTNSRSFKVTLMPPSEDGPKPLSAFLPGIKLGGKKPAGR